MSGQSQVTFRATLLGTGAPPPVLDRFGPSALVEAGEEKFVFDAGRGALQRLFQLGVPFSEVTGLFFTHHHSDHVVGIPDLWLTGWIRHPWGGRRVPLPVWGPTGTIDMMSHLEKAYEVDIRVRSRNYPAEGVALRAQETTEDVVYEKSGLKVTAFEVDHGSEILPAFGYRIDFAGRSAVLSEDTAFNENLIHFSQGTDLLVHEVTLMEESLRGSAQYQRITKNHTTPEQAAEVFSRVKPKLAIYTHILLFGDLETKDLIGPTRKNYSGQFEIGEDLMSIDVGEQLEVSRFKKN